MTIESWGFDQDSLDEWGLGTGRIRVVEVDLAQYFAILERHGR
jgi:hypothetical protein